MLKTLNTKSIESRKCVVGLGNRSRAGRDKDELDGSRMDNVEIDDSKVGGDEVRKKGRQMSKNLSKSKKTVGSDFFTPGARLAFTKLIQTFVKAPILHHFDSECHIQVETDALGHVIGRVLSQLTLDDLGQRHPMAFFSQKMILAKTRY